MVSLGLTKLRNTTSYRRHHHTYMCGAVYRAEMRYSVTKPSDREQKRRRERERQKKIHEVVSLNKFARHSTNKPFAIRFNHFGDAVRLSYKTQQQTHSKFVTMNFHDQLIRSLIITWDFISIDLCAFYRFRKHT